MIVTARKDSTRVGKVLLNGEDITNNTSAAYVSEIPKKTRLGWAIVYLRDTFDNIRLESIDGESAPMKRRRFGLIRWEAA